jgi:hypothetical protein
MNIVAIKLPVKKELNRLTEGTKSRIEFDKYSIPYEKNMFKMTTARTVLRISGEKASSISSLIEKISARSLKIK